MDRNFTASAINDEIDRVEEKWNKKVDLVCVDYLNIMQQAGISNGNKGWDSHPMLFGTSKLWLRKDALCVGRRAKLLMMESTQKR